MRISLASLVEGHWRIFILWLFVIGFNPYNFYALLYGAPTYCDISICPYLVYWIRVYVRFLVLILFLKRTNTLSCILYVCGLIFLFSSWLFLSIYLWLRRLIAYHSAMNGVFNVVSHQKTSWPSMACSIVWYVLRTAKSVSDNITEQGSP